MIESTFVGVHRKIDNHLVIFMVHFIQSGNIIKMDSIQELRKVNLPNKKNKKQTKNYY